MSDSAKTALGFDAASREAHVIGTQPRIEAIDDADVAPEVRASVNQTRASIGLGPAVPLPEYTRLMARVPPILLAHMDMGTAIFSGKLPPRQRELAVLRIGWLCGAPFEWGEHVGIAKRYGVANEEIERVIRGSSDAEWNPHDAAILRGVEELLGNYALSDATYETLARTWSEPQRIEYLMVVGHYVATALVQNSLRVRLTPANTGLRRR
jgi:4-carboxymuconolactone decarboxylase